MKQPAEPPKWTHLTQLGFQMVGIIALGVWIGYWIDGKTGWKFPAATLALTFISMGLSIYYFIRQLPKP